MLHRPDGTFDCDLDENFHSQAVPNTCPVEGVSSFYLVIDKSVGLKARIYYPATATDAQGATTATLSILDFFARALSQDPFSVIVFFHNGSFVHSSFSMAIYDQLCCRLVSLSSGAIIVIVSYHRELEHRWSCTYDDG
jgi:gibberellin receptor GID1